MTLHTVTCKVNGRVIALNVEARQNLAEALRSELGLTGTHLGCEHGVCGACTVLLDGAAVRGCLLLAVQAEGAEITTIEGVSPPSGLSDLQDSMRRHHALQCGFCTRSDARRSGDLRGDFRQSLPLHRLSADRRSGFASRSIQPRQNSTIRPLKTGAKHAAFGERQGCG